MHTQVEVIRIENLDGKKPGLQAKFVNPINEPLLITGIAIQSVQVSGTGVAPEVAITLSDQPPVGDFVLPPTKMPPQITDAPMYGYVADPKEFGIYCVLQPNQVAFVHISKETDAPVYWFDLLLTGVAIPPKTVYP